MTAASRVIWTLGILLAATCCTAYAQSEEVPGRQLRILEPSDNPAMMGRLGDYEILELIGRGGMGVVLKGYQRDLNRYVAVKVMAPHYASSGAARKRSTGVVSG